MAPVVYFIPGFGGSALAATPDGRVSVWADYTALAVGGMRKLRLAANGLDPQPPDGEQLFPVSILPAYYAPAIDELRRQVSARGYRLALGPYDWRMRSRRSGSLLAEELLSLDSSSLPATLVAHSDGGLTARGAWAELVDQGQEARVRRIITLGTPHWGSYRVVQLFTGSDPVIQQLIVLSAAASIALNASDVVNRPTAYSRAELASIAQTWVGAYEDLPTLDSPPAAYDPNRRVVYEGLLWRGPSPLSQAHLDEARDSFGPWLRSSASTPPPWVLTCFAGTGMPTYDRLLAPSALGTLPALGQTEEGDGTVTTDSALLAGSAQYTVRVAHADLPLALVRSGQVLDAILDPRGPPDPPPPPVVVPGVLNPTLAGPPLPGPLNARGFDP